MEHSVNFGQVQQTVTNRRQIEHSLVLRQEPNRSRMCGIGEKADRRPVDPPPIIQLHVTDPATSNNRVYLHNPYYFMYATLMDERGERELNTLNDKKARTMTGSVVASLAHLKDIDGNDGAFFVFPDLSVRCEGVYKLKFSLFEIVGNQVFFCKSITSDVFTVYSAKKFPGMDESTQLTKLFAEQGLKIRVRKEQKSTRPKGARSRPIATAHHSDRNSPVLSQHLHVPSWGVEHHRSMTAGSIGYSGAIHKPDHPQKQPPFSATPMSVVSPPVGPAYTGSSSKLASSHSNATWGVMQSHSTDVASGRTGLSHSPQQQPQTQFQQQQQQQPRHSISQYSAHSEAQANPDHDAASAGYGQYRQYPQSRHQHSHQQQQQQQQRHQQHGQYQTEHHGATRNLSPDPHPRYHGHQQAIASYSHPVAGTLSSSTAASGPASSGVDLQPIRTSGVAPQQSPYQSHHQQQMFSGKHVQSNPRAADHHSSYTPDPISARGHNEYSDHPNNRSLPQPLPHYLQQQQQQQQQQTQQQQQRHYYPPHRPWSPHHRAQLHYSPTHPGHAFSNEQRYSPYNRQMDTPRDGRQHASSSSSSSGARLSNLAAASSVESGVVSPPEQHSFRRSTHAAPRVAGRATPPESVQQYQKSPVHQQPQNVYSSMVKSDPTSLATLPPIPQNPTGNNGGRGGSGFGQHSQPHHQSQAHSQQQSQHSGAHRRSFINSSSPESRPSLPSFGAISGRDREPTTAGLSSMEAFGVVAAAAREASPVQQHRIMAVHSLLISDSSSPERPNGSSA